MKELASEYPVHELAWAFEVSRSGYYRWLKRAEGERARKARELTVHLQRIHQEKKQRYGSPRMCQQLRQEGIHTSENRVARLMKAAGIKARSKRAFRPRTTDSNHPHPIRPQPAQGSSGADCSQSDLGDGHHLHLDRPRLDLSGGRHGPVQPPDRRLGAQ